MGSKQPPDWLNAAADVDFRHSIRPGVAKVIFEGVITTLNVDGSAHITPMGFQRKGSDVVVSPFVPSQTLENLHRHHQAVINLTDDVRVVAGCLTERRDWPLVEAESVRGWRLADCLTSIELIVDRYHADAERPRFRCRIEKERSHRAYAGFNRARAAVIEAAILVSRLDFIAAEKLEAELTYLNIAVVKTAGEHEREAWGWLLDAVAAHPRGFFNVDVLR